MKYNPADESQPAKEDWEEMEAAAATAEPAEDQSLPPPAREGNGRPRRLSAGDAPNSVIEPESMLISVNHCLACGGCHHRVPYRKMTQSLGLFNHFYACEETGEPVPVSIAALDGKTLEVPQFMAAAIVRALLSGPYLFFIARVEGAELHLDRLTHQFPRDDLPKVVDLLAENLRKEVDPMAGKQIAAAPSPPADVMQLFRNRNR